MTLILNSFTKLSIDQEIKELLKEEIKARTNDNNLRLVLLTGSGAKNQLRKYSDIDLVFLLGQFDPNQEPYKLKYIGKRLISFTYKVFQEWIDNLDNLNEVRYLKPVILDSMLLYESETGIFQNLLNKASIAFPEKFEQISKEMVNSQISGYLEELHKLLNGIYSGNESAMLYGLLGVQMGLNQVLTNHYNIFLSSENDILNNIEENLTKEERGITLKEYFRRMLGYQKPDGGIPSVMDRSIAARDLYYEVILLVEHYLPEKNLELMETAKGILLESKSNYSI